MNTEAPYDPASPTKNWVGSGSGTTAYKWMGKMVLCKNRYTSSPGNTNDSSASTGGDRPWLIVGDSKDFIFKFIVSCFRSRSVYGFGSFEAVMAAIIYNFLLSVILIIGQQYFKLDSRIQHTRLNRANKIILFIST